MAEKKGFRIYIGPLFIVLLVIAMGATFVVSNSLERRAFLTAFDYDLMDGTSLFQSQPSAEAHKKAEPVVAETFKDLYKDMVLNEKPLCLMTDPSKKAVCLRDGEEKNQDMSENLQTAKTLAMHYHFAVPPYPDKKQQAAIFADRIKEDRAVWNTINGLQ